MIKKNKTKHNEAQFVRDLILGTIVFVLIIAFTFAGVLEQDNHRITILENEMNAFTQTHCHNETVQYNLDINTNTWIYNQTVNQSRGNGRYILIMNGDIVQLEQRTVCDK